MAVISAQRHGNRLMVCHDGLGQVITLKVAPKDLRTLNLAIEKSAWGIFETDIYPTYEFKGIAQSIKAKKALEDNE